MSSSRKLRKAAARASSARARRAHSRALAWRKAKSTAWLWRETAAVGPAPWDHLPPIGVTIADPFHPELISKYEDGK